MPYSTHSPAPIPPLSPADEALLLWIVGPIEPGDARPPLADPPDAIAQARFLARPEVQPLFQALQDLRAEIRHEQRVGQTIDTLLEVARKTDDLVERRRAATAVIRLLFPSRPRAITPPDSAERRPPSRRLQSPLVHHPDQTGLPDAASPPPSRRLQSPMVGQPNHAEFQSAPSPVAPRSAPPTLRNRFERAERIRRECIPRSRLAAGVAPFDST